MNFRDPAQSIREDRLASPARPSHKGRGKNKANGANGHAGDDATPDPRLFTVKHWIERELPAPDFLLGEVFATTSRTLLAAPTGCGKTGIAVAFGYSMAAGRDFLHWRCPRPARNVVLLDGEMSGRVAKRWLYEASERHGEPPENLFYINRDDFPTMRPLNTTEGQKFVDEILGQIGDVDFIIFDNMQALMTGSLRDEEPWADTLSWVRSLTRRCVGQLWLHHTSGTGVYGNKAVEWQMDSVGIMKDLRDQQQDGPLTDFSLEFTKARERNLTNRGDFATAHIWIENDVWQSSIEPSAAGKKAAKLSPSTARHLAVLKRAIDDGGSLVPPSKHVPSGAVGVPERTWRQLAYKANISDGTDEAKQKAFKRAAEQLEGCGAVAGWDGWVWLP